LSVNWYDNGRTSGNFAVTNSVTLPAIAQNQWFSLEFAFKNGQLWVACDGVVLPWNNSSTMTWTSLPVSAWADQLTGQEGLSWGGALGFSANTASVTWQFAELTYYRTARWPGVTPTLLTPSLTVTPASADGRTIKQAYRGGVHYHNWLTPVTLASTSNVATVTVTNSNPHGLSAGDFVLVNGADQAAFNGRFQVASVPTTSSLTYSAPGSGTVSATGSIIVLAEPTAALNARVAAAVGGGTGTSASGLIRTDKFLSSAPAKRGGTDATRPTLGHSGSYSYDWQIVDRDVAYIAARGSTLFLTMDSCPQLLGGTNAPASGTALSYFPSGATSFNGTPPRKTITGLGYSGTTATLTVTAHGYATNDVVYIDGLTSTPANSLNGTFTITVTDANTITYTVAAGLTGTAVGTGKITGPADLDEYATMCSDLVYHIQTELAHPLTYVSPWNEPNISTFWPQTPTITAAYDLYVRMFVKVALKLRADFGSTIKIGGPETSPLLQGASGILRPLLAACVANSITLDFVAFHYYSEELNAAQQAAATLAIEKAAASYVANTPELLLSEWQLNKDHRSGSRYPWRTYYVQQDDMNAAWTAHQFAHFHRNGFTGTTYYTTVLVNEAGNSAYDSGGVTGKAHTNTTGNVMQAWALMGPTGVTIDTNEPWPGCEPVFSTDGSGNVTGWLNFFRYRPDKTLSLPVTITGMAGRSYTVKGVDLTHSNYRDAGALHDSLETIATGTLDGTGAATITLPARSAYQMTVAATGITPSPSTLEAGSGGNAVTVTISGGGTASSTADFTLSAGTITAGNFASPTAPVLTITAPSAEQSVTLTHVPTGLTATITVSDTTAPVRTSIVAPAGQPYVYVYYTDVSGLDTGTTPDAADFTHSAKTVSAVLVTASYVRLTCNSNFTAGNGGTLSYTPGTNKVRDASAAHNLAASFSTQAVSVAVGGAAPLLTGFGFGYNL
jgi:hypothetical protein